MDEDLKNCRKRDERPTLERRQEKLDDSKRRYKEQCDKTGKEVTSRQLEKIFTGIAERTDRENGW